MYAYNTQIYHAAGSAPYKLALFNPPHLLAVKPTAQDRETITATQYFHRKQQWLAQLMLDTDKKMAKSQSKYKEYFDKRIWPPKKDIAPRSFVFVWMELYGLHDRKHKLTPVTKGPFPVVLTTDTKVMVRIGGKQERVARDRVVEVPLAVELMKDVLQIEVDGNETKRAEEEVTARVATARKSRRNTSSIG